MKYWILLLTLAISISNIYSDQKLTITIIDCCKDSIDDKIKNKVQNKINEYFNLKNNYRLSTLEQIENTFKKLNIKAKNISNFKAAKIGNLLNSHIILKYKIIQNENKLKVLINCIKVENKDVLITLKNTIDIENNNLEELNISFDKINNIIQAEEYLFTDKSESLLKRTVLILPFNNFNNVSDYEYLSNVMRDALQTELKTGEKFAFIDFSILETEIKKRKIKNEDFMDEKFAKDFAWDLMADVVVIGKYIIIDNELMINITAIDILKNQAAGSTKMNGELGIDVFRIIDDSAKDISEKMKKNIEMMSKSYYDRMKKLNIKKHNLKVKEFDENNPKYWTRHFFNISLGGGVYIFNNTYLPHSGLGFANELYGASLSGNTGYLYGFNKYFAFGPGVRYGVGFVYYYEPNSVNEEGHNLIAAPIGFAALLHFMIGDIKEKKIAFLLDIGGGYLFTVHFGMMYKNFIFKIGYDLSYGGAGHIITLSFGVMLNWKRKK